MNILIIGAGIGGLFIAKKLVEMGHKVTVFEKNSSFGGLAISHRYKDIYYDIGPHIVFSRDENILNEMLGFHDQWCKFERKNEVVINGEFIGYPFENYLGMLSSDLNNYCLDNFMNNPYKNTDPKNMEEFFLKKFGIGIFNTYLNPYNKKLWKSNLKDLDLQMVERIPDPPYQDVIEGSKGEFKTGYKHQAYFYYPKKGGINRFIQSIADTYKNTNIIRLNSKIIDINLIEKKVKVNCFEEINEYSFDKIISFMPLRELLMTLQSQILLKEKMIQKIEYLGLIYGVVELEPTAKSEFFALTIPDPEIVFHRITYLNDINNLSSNSGSKYYLFEITYKNLEQKLQILDNLTEKIIFGLEKTKVSPPSGFKSIEIRSIDKAYVVYNHFHKEVVNLANQILSQNNILIAGRLGGHNYLNMDQVIMDCYKILSMV
jgi:protoporphyrinogen oxidase